MPFLELIGSSISRVGITIHPDPLGVEFHFEEKFIKSLNRIHSLRNAFNRKVAPKFECLCLEMV